MGSRKRGDIAQEESKDKALKKQGSVAKYTIKDSVFTTTLFQDKKYLIQLYRALHPEDMETTEDELTDITIRNVLTNGMHNDYSDSWIIPILTQADWEMQ